MAEDDAGLHYLQLLRPKVMRACGAEFGRKLRANLARQMTGCPDPIMAIFAKGVLAERGIEGEEADRHLVAGAVRETEGMEEYAREAKVAEVQKAVGAVRVERVGGGIDLGDLGPSSKR
jgi:hypothetical protein